MACLPAAEKNRALAFAAFGSHIKTYLIILYVLMLKRHVDILVQFKEYHVQKGQVQELLLLCFFSEVLNGRRKKVSHTVKNNDVVC